MVVTVRVITAKFNGRCGNCDGEIAAGDRVNFHGRGNGVTHLTDDECRDHLEVEASRAEQRAEMRMEAWAEARFAGTTSSFWEDWG